MSILKIYPERRFRAPSPAGHSGRSCSSLRLYVCFCAVSGGKQYPDVVVSAADHCSSGLSRSAEPSSNTLVSLFSQYGSELLASPLPYDRSHESSSAFSLASLGLAFVPTPNTRAPFRITAPTCGVRGAETTTPGRQSAQSSQHQRRQQHLRQESTSSARPLVGATRSDQAHAGGRAQQGAPSGGARSPARPGPSPRQTPRRRSPPPSVTG